MWPSLYEKPGSRCCITEEKGVLEKTKQCCPQRKNPEKIRKSQFQDGLAARAAKQLEEAAMAAARLGQGQQRASEDAQKMPRGSSEEQQ